MSNKRDGFCSCLYFLIHDWSYTPKGDVFWFLLSITYSQIYFNTFYWPIIFTILWQAFIYYTFPPFQSFRRSASLWFILNARSDLAGLNFHNVPLARPSLTTSPTSSYHSRIVYKELPYPTAYTPVHVCLRDVHPRCLRCLVQLCSVPHTNTVHLQEWSDPPTH